MKVTSPARVKQAVAGHLRLGQEEPGGDEDEDDPHPVDGEVGEGEEGQHQGDAPGHAGDGDPRRGDLGEHAVDPQHQQEVGHVGVDQDLQHPLQPARLDLLHRGPAGGQGAGAPGPADVAGRRSWRGGRGRRWRPRPPRCAGGPRWPRGLPRLRMAPCTQRASRPRVWARPAPKAAAWRPGPARPRRRRRVRLRRSSPGPWRRRPPPGGRRVRPRWPGRRWARRRRPPGATACSMCCTTCRVALS